MQISLSVFWFGFCLLLGLSVSWLVVMFVSGFVCHLGLMFVSGFVCQLGVTLGIGFVCLWVGKCVTMPFNSASGWTFQLKILNYPMDFKLKMG